MTNFTRSRLTDTFLYGTIPITTFCGCHYIFISDFQALIKSNSRSLNTPHIIGASISNDNELTKVISD